MHFLVLVGFDLLISFTGIFVGMLLYFVIFCAKSQNHICFSISGRGLRTLCTQPPFSALYNCASKFSWFWKIWSVWQLSQLYVMIRQLTECHCCLRAKRLVRKNCCFISIWRVDVLIILTYARYTLTIYVWNEPQRDIKHVMIWIRNE